MELQDVYNAVKDLENRVIDLIEHQAKHNEILRTHESRSLALQAGQEKMDERLKPIERHTHIVGLGLKASGMVAVGAAIQWIVRHLFK